MRWLPTSILPREARFAYVASPFRLAEIEAHPTVAPTRPRPGQAEHGRLHDKLIVARLFPGVYGMAWRCNRAGRLGVPSGSWQSEANGSVNQRTFFASTLPDGSHSSRPHRGVRVLAGATWQRSRFRHCRPAGDGIGIDVTTEAVKVLVPSSTPPAASASVSASTLADADCYRRTGDYLPPTTLDAARAADAVLLGAMRHPCIVRRARRHRTRPQITLAVRLTSDAVRRALSRAARLSPRQRPGDIDPAHLLSSDEGSVRLDGRRDPST